MIYGIEANFYTGGGSKLNETARSYKNIAVESNSLFDFTFVWFTDGKGWTSARHNLEETFDIMEHIYSIEDMENGVMERLFIKERLWRKRKLRSGSPTTSSWK